MKTEIYNNITKLTTKQNLNTVKCIYIHVNVSITYIFREYYKEYPKMLPGVNLFMMGIMDDYFFTFLPIFF